MALINDLEPHIERARQAVESAKAMKSDKLAWDAFRKCFGYRFCWSSNGLEGNTLSLDETIAVVDFDEVSSGHTFSEYREAKDLYRAIQETLSFEPAEITVERMQNANAIICGTDGGFRATDVFIGSATEAIFYPPSPARVPELAREFVDGANGLRFEDFSSAVAGIAERHIHFERIHPFRDGNGRTGRIIMNQMLVNHGILPSAISHKSQYRQAFRAYDRNRDTSMLVYLLCGALVESARSLAECHGKRIRDQWGQS